MSVKAKPPSTSNFSPVTFATLTLVTGSFISSIVSAKSLRIAVFMLASSVDVANVPSAV